MWYITCVKQWDLALSASEESGRMGGQELGCIRSTGSDPSDCSSVLVLRRIGLCGHHHSLPPFHRRLPMMMTEASRAWGFAYYRLKRERERLALESKGGSVPCFGSWLPSVHESKVLYCNVSTLPCLVLSPSGLDEVK